MEVVALPDAGSIIRSEHAEAILLAPAAAIPAGADAVLPLADGRRIAYVPLAPARALAPAQLTIDPFVRGNKFAPLHDSDRALAALISIAAGRRVDTGPESERLFVFLRGAGLVFDQNDNTLRFEAHHAALIPAGEPARVWAQGPEDVLAVVFQPKGAAIPRRTLSSEIARRRSELSSAERSE